MKLGNLKAVRENKKLRQEDVAREANLSQSTIHRIESGGECNRNSAERIAKVLKVRIELLVAE